MPAPGGLAHGGAEAPAEDPALPTTSVPAGTGPRHPAPAPAQGEETARLIPGRGAVASPPHRPVPGGEAGDETDRALFGAAAAPGASLRMPRPGEAFAQAGADADAEPTMFVPPEVIAAALRPSSAGEGEGEGADDDRTRFADEADDLTRHMPAPGGQRTLLPPRPAAAPAPGRAPRAGVELQRLVAGVNPLLGAASVLLALVAQLRATSAHADPAGLRRQLLAHMAEFEAQAAASGVPRPRITAARYLLCSFLDEVIAATPWGMGTWDADTLLSEYHEERWGGDKCFELLERLGQNPAANAEVLELFYVCLALGFEGRYHGQPDGRARLEAIAERVLAEVQPAALQPPQGARSLSLHWQGVSAPQRPGLHLPPLWSVAVLAAALVLAALLGFQLRLAAQARPLLRELHALPAALQAERASAGATGSVPAAGPARLAPLLQAEVAAGALAVRDERLRSVLTLPADELFKGSGAELQARAPALLGRVAQALRAQPGQVNVIGHSDDATAASLQFPTAWHLSRARAQAVLDELARQGLPAERLHAEGRADAEPLVSGHSAAERARNRRVEIELRLPRPEG
jgi:type VI secretion system protein ImpK